LELPPIPHATPVILRSGEFTATPFLPAGARCIVPESVVEAEAFAITIIERANAANVFLKFIFLHPLKYILLQRACFKYFDIALKNPALLKEN